MTKLIFQSIKIRFRTKLKFQKKFAKIIFLNTTKILLLKSKTKFPII